jgi:hypothetical protein
MTARKKRGPGGPRKGAGRPPIDNPRTERREVKLTPEEAAAHDVARGDEPWGEWIRAAAELAIARGSTR